MFSLQGFRDAYPEFSGVSDPVVISWGEFAEKFWNKAVWGKFYDDAVNLLVAHRLAVLYDISESLQENGMKDADDTSMVTSKTATTGSLSMSNAVSSLATGDNPLDVDFSRTNYGLLLLELIQLLMPAGRVCYSLEAGGRLPWTAGRVFPI